MTRVQTSSTSLNHVDDPLPTGWAVPWSLLLLAGPIIASMCSRTVMSFTDFVMVSQLGTPAQAAIMPAGILLFCVISFGMGVMTAVNTFVSQSLGRGDHTACAAFAWQGFYLALAVGLIVLPAWFGVPALFAWVGHAPKVQAMEVIYVRIGLLGVGPSLAASAIDNFFNGIHRPIVGLWTMIICTLLNVLLDYSLIFGHFGAPTMGIAGAATATAIASTLQASLLLAWMLRPKMARTFHSRAAWRLDLSRLRSLIGVGLPAGVQFTVDVVTFSIFTLLLIGEFGTVQLAANNIAFKLLEVSFMPTVGLGVALTASVGKAIGRGQADYARLLTRWAAVFGVGYMGLIAVVYVVAGHDLVGLLSDNQAVVAWTTKLLLFCAVFQIFDALNIIHLGALRGAGDNRWPACVAAAMACSVFVGGGYLLAFWKPQWGAAGPWTAATAYIVLLGLVMWGRWTFGPWQRIDLFKTT